MWGRETMRSFEWLREQVRFIRILKGAYICRCPWVCNKSRSGWYPAVFDILLPPSHQSPCLGCWLVQVWPGEVGQPLDTRLQHGQGSQPVRAAGPGQGCAGPFPPPSQQPAVHRLRALWQEWRWRLLPPFCPSGALPLFLGLCVPAEGAREWQSLATDCHWMSHFGQPGKYFEQREAQCHSMFNVVTPSGAICSSQFFHHSDSPAAFSVPNSLKMLISFVYCSLYFSLQLLWNVCQ